MSTNKIADDYVNVLFHLKDLCGPVFHSLEIKIDLYTLRIYIKQLGKHLIISKIAETLLF